MARPSSFPYPRQPNSLVSPPESFLISYLALSALSGKPGQSLNPPAPMALLLVCLALLALLIHSFASD